MGDAADFETPVAEAPWTNFRDPSVPGLDVSPLLAGSGANTVKAQAGTFDREAAADNVRATPTILVGKSGGALRPVALAAPSDEQSVASAINAALS